VSILTDLDARSLAKLPCVLHRKKGTGKLPVIEARNQASAILRIITEWAKVQKNVHGLALVGSHARNAARPGSDIDLVVLAQNPNSFRDPTWLTTIDWSRAGVHPIKWADEEYGVVWSRRTWLRPEGEVEFGFAPLSWADVSPVDQGTQRVVSDGCRVLYDPDGLLKRLTTTVACL
jgi:predicted nucleotidyltransferase